MPPGSCGTQDLLPALNQGLPAKQLGPGSRPVLKDPTGGWGGGGGCFGPWSATAAHPKSRHPRPTHLNDPRQHPPGGFCSAPLSSNALAWHLAHCCFVSHMSKQMLSCLLSNAQQFYSRQQHPDRWHPLNEPQPTPVLLWKPLPIHHHPIPPKSAPPPPL